MSRVLHLLSLIRMVSWASLLRNLSRIHSKISIKCDMRRSNLNIPQGPVSR
ncbi:Dihydroxy-acid dehydratase [Clarias magur]|uniref:Dihydroxy-acid dehydratase n=1 Tax=Clarias magur TaxID=1594786 RepID=A0A8J4X8M2_CLAMG|nr:Dihydroxy-acid dehydratase [Clarias magur]